MAAISINEPIGAKYFLTRQGRSCIHIEPNGFLSMLNQIPQPLLQPRRLGDLLLPNRVVMASLTRGRAAPLDYSWCDARRAADVAQASK
jgi:hypothetical protein